MNLKQIGMRTGALKSNSTLYGVDFINKNPVTLNMAVERAFPFAVKRVVIAFRRQGLFVDDHVHDFAEFTEILTAFFRQFELFSENFCKRASQHGSVVRVVRIILHKVFPHLISRSVPLGGNFPARNSHAFLNGGDSLGIVARISGYGVEVRGANGARVRMDVFVGSSFSSSIWRPLVYSRSKSKYSPPRRYFAGYVNNQPVAGGNFYSLRNAHKEIIPQPSAKINKATNRQAVYIT